MNYSSKLIMLISLFFLSSFSVQPHFQQIDQKALTQDICELMDEARKVETYWQEINHSTLKKYTSTFPTHWFDEKWHQETPLKADVARALFDKLALFLGELELDKAPSQETSKKWHQLKAESYAVLNTCAIPSRWQRHWIAYTVGSLAVVAAYCRIKHKLSGQMLFEIKDPQNLKDVVNQMATPQGPHTHLDTYRYCQKDGVQFIEVAKNDAPAVRNFLQERHCTDILERTPTLNDITTKLYNENGTTHAQHWFKEHCVKPCKDLYSILFTDRHRSDISILASDIKRFEQNWQSGLDDLIKNAVQCPEIAPCVSRISGDTPLDQLSFNQKRAIHTELLFYFNKNFHQDSMRFLNEAYNAAQVDPAERGRLSNFITGTLGYTLDPELKMYGTISKWIPTVGALLEKIKTEQAAPNSPLGLLTNTIALAGLEKTLQINSVLNTVGNLADAQKLTFATMATIPIGLIGYVAYKSTTSIIAKITKRTFIEPLKHDLLSLQITLNSHRYHDTLDAHTTGLCRYITTRLQQYLKKLSAKERPRYALYIEQLANDLHSPEQRIQVIECMFKEFSFLH